ncbi:hypothetical protein D3C76_1829040 [compost metagenome]
MDKDIIIENHPVEHDDEPDYGYHSFNSLVEPAYCNRLGCKLAGVRNIGREILTEYGNDHNR